MAASLATPPLDPEAIRKDFPILHAVADNPDRDSPLAYLDNASTTQPPRQVVEAMVEVYKRNYCNVHRGAYCMLREMTAQYEKVREKARRVPQCARRRAGDLHVGHDALHQPGGP